MTLDAEKIVSEVFGTEERSTDINDIRCYNIVFPEESTKRPGLIANVGCLIDFDFGGKLDARSPPKFPEGYRPDKKGRILRMA
jgi:hypothetical protein